MSAVGICSVARTLWLIAPVAWALAVGSGLVAGAAAWRLDGATGVVVAALVPSVFASIVVHEVGHIRAARLLGVAHVSIGVQGWSVFVDRSHAASPAREALIAVAGPGACVLVGCLLVAAVATLGTPQALPLAVIWLVQGASLLPRQHDGIRLRRAWSDARKSAHTGAR